MTAMKNRISNTFREVTYNNTKKERAAHTVHSTKRPKMISVPWNAQRGYTSLIFVLFSFCTSKISRCDAITFGQHSQPSNDLVIFANSSDPSQ